MNGGRVTAPSATVTSASLVQPANGPCGVWSDQVVPHATSVEGSSTSTSEVQPEKAPAPSHCSEAGRVTCASEVQPENAASPIWVTDAGRATEVSVALLANALAAMAVTACPSMDEGTLTWVAVPE